MPLLQYFSCVGAVLLALIMIAGSYLPHQPAGADAVRYEIRVTADRSGGSLVAGPTTFADFSGGQLPSAQAASSAFREALAKAEPAETDRPKPRGVRSSTRHAKAKASSVQASSNQTPRRTVSAIPQWFDAWETDASRR